MNDYSKDTDNSDLNSPLILKDVADQNAEKTFKNAILKINKLIKTKYSLVKKEENQTNNKVVKNFIDIKRSAGQLIKVLNNKLYKLKIQSRVKKMNLKNYMMKKYYLIKIKYSWILSIIKKN